MKLDLYRVDKEVFIYLNTLHLPELDKFMFFARDLLLWVPLILLSVFVLSKYSANKMRPHSLFKTIMFGVFVLLQVVLCVFILPHVFDLFIQRIRPAYNSEILQYVDLSYFRFPEKEEFYAAKICTVAAVSVFFIAVYDTTKWLKVSLVLWTLFISYNRIYTGAHYPSNVLLSMILGIGIGVLTYRYHQYLKNSVIVI